MNHKDEKALRAHKTKLDKKLCPCPFCGGHAQLDNTYTAHYWVECTDCSAQVSDPVTNRNANVLSEHKASMDATAKAWNNRFK